MLVYKNQKSNEQVISELSKWQNVYTKKNGFDIF